MQSQAFNDRELIARYLNGDERAFVTLLHRHKAKVFTSIFLMVKDHAVADDIFQDTFVKVVETLRSGRYNEEGKFVQWVMRIAHNQCVDHFRRQKPTGSIDDILTPPAFSGEGPDAQLIRDQTCIRVQTLINHLPFEQREVVILRHYADMSFKEIAQQTNVSINTALGRMRYALLNMRKIMVEKQISLQ